MTDLDASERDRAMNDFVLYLLDQVEVWRKANQNSLADSLMAQLKFWSAARSNKIPDEWLGHFDAFNKDRIESYKKWENKPGLGMCAPSIYGVDG